MSDKFAYSLTLVNDIVSRFACLRLKMDQFQSGLPFWSLVFLKEFLWNALDESPGFLLFNLRYKSLILSDSQTLTEIVFIVQLQILHKKSLWENNVVELTSRELNTISIKIVAFFLVPSPLQELHISFNQ